MNFFVGLAICRSRSPRVIADAIRLGSAATTNRVVTPEFSFRKRPVGTEMNCTWERCTRSKTKTRLDEVSYNYQSFISTKLRAYTFFAQR